MVELPAPSTPVIETSTVDWARSVEADSAYTDVNSVSTGPSRSTKASTAKNGDATSRLSKQLPQHDSKVPWHCYGADEPAPIDATRR